jgi:hypothetical protein
VSQETDACGPVETALQHLVGQLEEGALGLEEALEQEGAPAEELPRARTKRDIDALVARANALLPVGAPQAGPIRGTALMRIATPVAEYLNLMTDSMLEQIHEGSRTDDRSAFGAEVDAEAHGPVALVELRHLQQFLLTPPADWLVTDAPEGEAEHRFMQAYVPIAERLGAVADELEALLIGMGPIALGFVWPEAEIRQPAIHRLCTVGSRMVSFYRPFLRPAKAAPQTRPETTMAGEVLPHLAGRATPGGPSDADKQPE